MKTTVWILSLLREQGNLCVCVCVCKILTKTPNEVGCKSWGALVSEMPKRKLEQELSEECKMEAGVVGGVNDRAEWIHRSDHKRI